jgi:hypothetical protein
VIGDKYSLHGSCIVNNETGQIVCEAEDTPRNRRKLSQVVRTSNQRERDRESLARLMGANRCAWL